MDDTFTHSAVALTLACIIMASGLGCTETQAGLSSDGGVEEPDAARATTSLEGSYACNDIVTCGTGELCVMEPPDPHDAGAGMNFPRHPPGVWYCAAVSDCDLYDGTILETRTDPRWCGHRVCAGATNRISGRRATCQGY